MKKVIGNSSRKICHALGASGMTIASGPRMATAVITSFIKVSVLPRFSSRAASAPERMAPAKPSTMAIEP